MRLVVNAINTSFVIIYFASVVSSLGGRLGFTCSGNVDCQSQNCVPICNSSIQKCIEPKWYLLRHGFREAPKCIDESLSKKLSSLHHPRNRGETCVNNGNCMTRNCVPECEQFNQVHRCIEPFSFYLEQKMKLPQCVSIRKSLELKKAAQLDLALMKGRSNKKKHDIIEQPLDALKKLDEKLKQMDADFTVTTEAEENRKRPIFANTQLTSASSDCVSESKIGYITDNYSWESPNHIGVDDVDRSVNPSDVTKEFLLNQNSVKHGYCLLSLDGKTYSQIHDFTTLGNEIVFEYIKESPDESGFQVKAMGEYCNNSTFILGSVKELDLSQEIFGNDDSILSSPKSNYPGMTHHDLSRLMLVLGVDLTVIIICAFVIFLIFVTLISFVKKEEDESVEGKDETTEAEKAPEGKDESPEGKDETLDAL